MCGLRLPPQDIQLSDQDDTVGDLIDGDQLTLSKGEDSRVREV